MVCLIFHTDIMISRKNWRVTVRLHFENLSIFFKTANIHTCQDHPPPDRFCLLFNDPPLLSPPQQMPFLNDFLLYHQGTKRKHDHRGRLQNYSWNKENCLTLISSVKSTEKINFTELAQKVNLKNKKGNRTLKLLLLNNEN